MMHHNHRNDNNNNNNNNNNNDKKTFTGFVTPPSPIPTGKGSRTAGTNDKKLNEYFHGNLQIPYLRLPDYSRVRVPAQIDYRLLVSRVGNSIERLVRSGQEFGVVRITGHGIGRDEVGSVRAEVELFFKKLDERKGRFRRSFVDRVGNREEFVWFRSDKAMLLWAREVMGSDRYRDFSRKMESVVSKLDKIAEELAEVFSKFSAKRFEKAIEERESIISLYRYNDTHPSLLVSNEDIHESYDHALSLHLAMEQGEFYVQTEKGPLSFTTDPDTIIVTVGDQLMDWSAGDLKAVSGELIFDPNLHGAEASYSLEIKCSPLNLNFGYTKKVIRTISLFDQLLIVVIFSFLYKIMSFALSKSSMGTPWLYSLR